MSESHVTYWAAQVRELVTDDVRVVEQRSKNVISVILPSKSNTREERAKLIRSLERAGCVVISTTRDEIIEIDAGADELPHAHDDSVTY